MRSSPLNYPPSRRHDFVCFCVSEHNYPVSPSALPACLLVKTIPPRLLRKYILLPLVPIIYAPILLPIRYACFWNSSTLPILRHAISFVLTRCPWTGDARRSDCQKGVRLSCRQIHTNSTAADSSSSTETPPPTTSSSETSSSSTPPPTTSTTSSSTPPPTTSSTKSDPPTSTSTTSDTPTSSSTPPPTSSSTPPPTSSTEESSSTEAPTSSSTPPSSTDPTSTPPISTPPSSSDSTETTTITSFATGSVNPATTTGTSATGTPTFISGGKGSSGSLDQNGVIAVAVVVPIAGVALIVLAGLFLWRRRKQRMHAEEERRKEVEDYAYNPNDPTLPNIGGAGAFEMKEDASSGYRGWGSTTLAGSTGRKASTTMSGAGAAYSEGTSPAQGNFSDTRSGEPLMSDGSHTPEGEILGAMGPNSADNRSNVHRGPSNASSSYSAAGRSDGSGENPAYGGAAYYDQYGSSNPYSDPYTDNPTGGQVQPVIRDNPARRNTRIENPSPYPQQSAGISQNF
ncbi:hypothetical protein CIB48_g4325 [Xylaria polymorpha]|nr:hypothetical protein CIB48_g4325 [Xylaria polymorpha]